YQFSSGSTAYLPNSLDGAGILRPDERSRRADSQRGTANSATNLEIERRNHPLTGGDDIRCPRPSKRNAYCRLGSDRCRIATDESNYREVVRPNCEKHVNLRPY